MKTELGRILNRVSLLRPMLLAAALVAGCDRHPPKQTAEQLPALKVHVQVLEKKPHIATEDVVGTVRSRLTAAIEAKVSGRVEKMLAVPGHQVKAGELLAEIDAKEMQARLEQARAVREQADRDLQRFTGLLSKGAATRQEFDNAQAKARVAGANVAEAETMLGYTKVVAPFDGVITRKLADVGDLASPGKPLVEIENPNALRLESGIPDALIDNLSIGMELPVRIATVTLKGKVSEMAPSADPNSRTSLVKVDLPLTQGVRAGQFGRVSVPLSSTSVLRAPASAVIQRGQMEIAFVREHDHARMRLVKSGKQIDGEVEIVSGLEPGEQVIVDQVSTLSDGQPVEVLP